MTQTLPEDFAGRLRAARAYMDLTREDFAALLSLRGTSASNIKAYETNERVPPNLVAHLLVGQLASVTGLPQSFFFGEKQSPTEAAIDRLLNEVQQLRRELLLQQAPVLDAVVEPRHREASARVDGRAHSVRR